MSVYKVWSGSPTDSLKIDVFPESDFDSEDEQMAELEAFVEVCKENGIEYTVTKDGEVINYTGGTYG